MIKSISLVEDLIAAAKEGVENAFSRMGREDEMRFGSAVLTAKGNIYSAGQYYSDTFSLTLHAEQVAIAHAAAHGEYAIIAIASLGNEAAYRVSGGLIYPCHMCKQLLWESYLRSGQDISIYTVNPHDQGIERHLLSEIFQQPWPYHQMSTDAKSINQAWAKPVS